MKPSFKPIIECRRIWSWLPFSTLVVGRIKTYIRHDSPVEFETLFRRDGKLKMGEHSSFLGCFFFFEFCRIFQWSRSLRFLSSADSMMINPRRTWLCKKQTWNDWWSHECNFNQKRFKSSKRMVSSLKLSLWCILLTCATKINFF